jgi:hypothetical protein
MSEDPPLDAAPGSSLPGGQANGSPRGRPDELVREVIMLRARCSNLRHWCRRMLADPVAAGVLPTPTEADLQSTTPEVSESEGQDVVALLARGGNVPPTHPLAPNSHDPVDLRAAAARLTPEWEGLRGAFFTLLDRLHPGDDLTDDDFLEHPGPGITVADVIAEYERESRSTP